MVMYMVALKKLGEKIQTLKYSWYQTFQRRGFQPASGATRNIPEKMKSRVIPSGNSPHWRT